jgi:hypothetical protein
MDANAIAQMGCPVLCIDTCSLLDIFRDPTRLSLKPHDHQAIIETITAVKDGRAVCLIAEQVKLEFAEYDTRVQEETRRNLGKVREQVEVATLICSEYGTSTRLDLTHLDILLPATRSFAETLIQAAIHLKPGPDIPGKAFARLNGNIAPATRGKESSKDCLVYETYLEAVTRLRQAGLTAPIVFLSSNTKDYRTEGGVLKPEIACELAPLSCEYASNMRAARASLKV